MNLQPFKLEKRRFQKTVHPKMESQWGPKQHCKLFIHLVIYPFSNNLSYYYL